MPMSGPTFVLEVKCGVNPQFSGPDMIYTTAAALVTVMTAGSRH